MRLDFVADIADKDRYRLVLAQIDLFPGQLIEVLLREHPCKVPDQQLDNSVFLAGQRQRAAMNPDTVGRTIQHQILMPEFIHRLTGSRPLDMDMDAGNQFLKLKRLRHIIIGAQREQIQLMTQLILGREDNHRNPALHCMNASPDNPGSIRSSTMR